MENTHKRLQLLEVAFMVLASMLIKHLPIEEQKEAVDMLNEYAKERDDLKVYDL